ncbi:MAG: OmpH family outer membrane protein [Emcibacteraceae bacterium]|jgi:outer membrane protein|nr:OmpH family outer membrane protein [Emcibacteraceae bacterium]
MFNKLAMALLATAMMAAPSVYAEMKIVVLDPARAIAGSDEGKLLLANLESELKEDQDKLVANVEAFQAMQAKLQKDGEVMSDSDKRKAVKELESMQADIQFAQQKLQKEAQERQQEILQSLAPQFQKVRDDLIQIDQIDMIVAPNALQYANPKHDITKRVTEKMNEQSK